MSGSRLAVVACAFVASVMGLTDPSKECHQVHEAEHGILSGAYHCWHIVPDSDAAGSIGFKFVKFDFGEGQRLTLHKGALKDEASKIGEFSAFNPPPATYVSAEKELTMVYRTSGATPNSGGKFQLTYFRSA